MSLPFWTTNPYTLLTLSNIEAEYGGEAPTNFSEYYAGAPSGYVSSDRVGYPLNIETPIPKTGALAISNFYGGSSVPYSIVTDKPTYNEGETITFSITSPDLDDTDMFWTIEDSTVPINITPATLPSGSINTPYTSTQISASGGQGPYTYNLVYGVLPAGLTISPTGIISGTPTSVGSTTFGISATDANMDVGLKEYSITIVAVVVAIQPLSTPNGIINRAYPPLQLVASGGTAPYTFTFYSGSLPTGMSMSSSGLISGTPTVDGRADFTVKVTDQYGNFGLKSYNLSIETIDITLSPLTLPVVLVRVGYTGGNISAAGGTAPYTYTLTSGRLPTGISLSSSSGALSGTTTEVGTFLFTVKAVDSNTNSGQQNFSLQVTTVDLTLNPATLPGGLKNTPYEQTLSVTGGIGPYTYSLLTGTLPMGLSLVGNKITGTPTVVQSSVFKIKVVDSNGNSTDATYTIGIAAVNITIEPDSLEAAIKGTEYSEQLTATGGVAPYVFNVVDTLPPGLTLNQQGYLSGTPTTTGIHSFSVEAIDNNTNSGTKSYSLSVLSNVWQIALRGKGPAPVFVDEGDMLTFDVSAPASLNTSVSAYLIFGAPKNTDAQDIYYSTDEISIVNRTGSIEVRVNADYITETVEFANVWLEYPRGTLVATYGNVSINDTAKTPTSGCDGELILDAGDPEPAAAYSSFSYTLSVSNGTGPYTWTQVSGTLPTGLTFFAANATVAGLPTTPVTNRAVIYRARDSQGLSGYCTYNFTITAPEITISPETLNDGVVGESYTQIFTASGGATPYTFTVTAGTLPAGFTFNGSTLTGVPTSKDPATFTITAKDVHNFTGSQQYTISFDTAPIEVKPYTIPDLWVQSPYSVQFSAAGGAAPYTYNIDSATPLPAGLSMSNTGLLSGTPAELSTDSYPGSASFKVIVTDRYGDTGEESYSVAINALYVGAPGDNTLTHAQRIKKLFRDVTSGFNFITTITASGGTAPYNFSLLYGTLPGWTLTQVTQDTVSIGGLTKGKGTTTFTIKVTDALGRSRLIAPSAYIFPLVKPAMATTYYYNTFPDNELVGYNGGGILVFTYVVFRTDGSWEIQYTDKNLNRRYIDRGNWYDGQIDINTDGRAISVASTTSSGTPVWSIKTYLAGQQIVTAWTAALWSDKRETESASLRLFWNGRTDPSEEYIWRLNIGWSSPPPPPPPPPSPVPTPVPSPVPSPVPTPVPAPTPAATYVFQVDKDWVDIPFGDTTFDIWLKTTNVPAGTLVPFSVGSDNYNNYIPGGVTFPSSRNFRIGSNGIGYIQITFNQPYMGTFDFNLRIYLTNKPTVEQWIEIICSE